MQGPGDSLTIKMLSYQSRNTHYKDKTVSKNNYDYRLIWLYIYVLILVEMSLKIDSRGLSQYKDAILPV